MSLVLTLLLASWSPQTHLVMVPGMWGGAWYVTSSGTVIPPGPLWAVFNSMV